MSTYYQAINLYGIKLPYDNLEQLQKQYELDIDIQNSVYGDYYLGVNVELGVTEEEAKRQFLDHFGLEIYSKYPPKFHTFVTSY